MEEAIKYFIKVLPPVIIGILLGSIVVFHYYNTIKEFFGDILHSLNIGTLFFNKKATSYILEGKIGNSIQHVTSNKSILPKGLTIEWSNGVERETFLRNNKVVVVLNKNEPENRQFVRAVMELVRRGLIPCSKIRLDKRIVDAADTKVAQSIISQKGSDTITYFEETFLKPYFNREENKRRIFDMLRLIEKNGMLYELLLNEFEEVSRLALDDGPNEALEQESMEFLNFVNRIAGKRPGEVVPLSFLRKYFRVAVVLATKDGTGVADEEEKLYNYIAQIQKSIDNGAWKIYIYALGRKVERAKEIAAISSQIDGRIINENYQKYVKNDSYKRRMIEGICIELTVSKIGQ